MVEHADVLILGGGSGGYSAAFRAAQLGKSVTLVEADKVGGTCLHRGCIPTKALLHAGEVADTISSAAQLGFDAPLNSVDMSKILSYKDAVVDRLYSGLQGLVRARKINLVTGYGRYEYNISQYLL